MIQLDEAGVRARLSMPEVIAAMEKALAAFSGGEVDQPVRSVVEVEPKRGFLGVMPAHLRDSDSLGCKLVTVFQGNHNVGLPAHQAVILLFDSNTGSLQAIMDGRYITEVRTAAASAVSARLLANPGARRVAILGSGVQARSHVEALSCVLERPEFVAYSPNRKHLEEFAAESGAGMAASTREALADAELVVVATSSTVPVLEAAWVKPGAHVMAVGACRYYMRELPGDLVAASGLYVDSRAAAVTESGDILIDGLQDRIRGEIGELLLGKIEGRRSAEEITLFKSLGLAVEDVATARLVYGRAVKP